MVTGEQPFPGETMTAVSYKIVHTEPIPPAKLNPAIPGALEAVILKCLAKNPAERFQTGDELAKALAELRTTQKTSGLNAVVPQAVSAAGDSVPTSLPPKAGQESLHPTAAQPPTQTPPAKPAKPPNAKLVLTLALVFLVLASGGGYVLTHRKQPAAPQPQPTPVATAKTQEPASQEPAPQTSTPSPTAPSKPEKAAAASPAQAAVAAKAVKPKPGKNVVSATTPPPAPQPVSQPAPQPVAQPAPAPAPSSQSAAVAFDPRKLDPKQNTRLKIDMESLPPSASFVVDMDGKTYFKGSILTASTYNNLYVPPGVHEFYVTVSAESIQKKSKIVSAEFVARKRMTLKVELRTQANGTAPVPPVLDANSTVVATLKTDRFFF